MSNLTPFIEIECHLAGDTLELRILFSDGHVERMFEPELDEYLPRLLIEDRIFL